MGSPSLQVQFDPSSARFGASRTQKRLEDDRLLVGKGRYSDDLEFAGLAWLVVVRSPHAHADISALDLSGCRSAAGVIAAWSMADLRADGVAHIPFPPLFKRADGAPMAAPPRTLLAEDRVYYVGQPVVAIVAETRRQAEDAADLVSVQYEELPCVVDARRAVEAGAPLVWQQATGNIAAEAAYGDAAAVDKAFAAAAHITELELHHQPLVAAAPRARCALPVGSSAIIPLSLGPKVQTTVYDVPVVDYRVKAVLTNSMATGAYRGAGRPEANYLMERLMEKAAREMRLDPVEIRRRNFIRPEDFPYRTHLGDVYDSGNFPRIVDRLVELADWRGFAARREQSRSRGRLRGRGLSVYLEWTGALPTETVDIPVRAGGPVTGCSGTHAMGQGP